MPLLVSLVPVKYELPSRNSNHVRNRRHLKLSTMPSRVAVVVSHPIQYFCSLYRCITASGEVQIRVLCASDAGLRPNFDGEFGRMIEWQPDLAEGLDHEFGIQAVGVGGQSS